MRQKDFDFERSMTQLTMPSATSCSTEWSLIDKNGVPFRLPRTMIFLGREECDIALKSRSVDKRHAVITYDHYQNKFKLKDLSSINGTFINDSRIPEQVYITLENKDVIRFGYDPMVYKIERLQEENIDSGLPTPENLQAWNRLAECKGCVTEQSKKPAHTNGSRDDLNDSGDADSPLHTCEDNHNVESGYDTWPDRRKATRQEKTEPKPATDLIESPRDYQSSIADLEEQLQQRKLRNAEEFGNSNISPDKENEDGNSFVSAKSQIKFWEEKNQDRNKMADIPGQNHQNENLENSITSPERPTDLDLSQNNNGDCTSKYPCTWEISHLSDDSHLLTSSEKVTKQLNGSGSSEPPGTAFTVNLGDEDEDAPGSPKFDVSQNLSNFLPSKIRRSFRERASTRKDKGKEELSPVRQKKIDDLWTSSSPSGSQRPKLKQQSMSTGYTSEGYNPSDPEDDRSTRSEGPPSRSKRKSDIKPRSSSFKEPKNRPIQSVGAPVSETSAYLIDKMFQSTRGVPPKSPKVVHPPEYYLYKEAQSYDNDAAARKTSMPTLEKSPGEPAKSRQFRDANDEERSPAVSPAGTYTIEDEPAEVTEARQSIEKVLSQSMESSGTMVASTESVERDEYRDSLERDYDNCDIDDLERERARREVIGSVDVEVGSAVDESQTDISNISQNAPKWVSQWASLTSKSGQAKETVISPSKESPAMQSPTRSKARPGTGRKLPNPPMKQNSQSDVGSSVGSESSGPNSPQNQQKNYNSVFSRLSEPKNRNRLDKASTVSKPATVERRPSMKKEADKTEKWKVNNPEVGASPWRRYRTEKSADGAETARSSASIDTDILLQDTANVMAAMNQKRIRESTFTKKSQPPNSLEIREGSSDKETKPASRRVETADKNANRFKPKTSVTNTRKSFPLTRTDSKEKNLSSRFVRQSSDAFSDVMSETEGLDSVSLSSESSIAMSEDRAQFKRQGSKGKGAMSMTRPNRAFSLRRARLEAEEEKSSPKTRSRSNSCASTSSESRPNTGRTEASLGAKIVKKSQDNAKSSFSRSDGGRHSLRLNKAPLAKQSAKTTPNRPTSANKRNGNASQPGSRSASPKSQEWNAWERRKGYDPRRAVADAKAKSKKMPDSKTKDSAARRLSGSGDQGSLPLQKDDLSSAEELGSSHSVEIAKMSSALARDMEALSRDEAGLNNSSTEELVRNIFSNGNTSVRSAFSAPKFTRSPSPLKSPPTPLTPGQRSTQVQNSRLENGVIKRKEWDKAESYDNLIVSSVYQLSNKLKGYTDNIIGKLRENHSVSKTPSPIDELLDLPCSSEIPGWKSANQELAGVLRQLRKVEHHLQVIDRVVNTNSDSASVISSGSSYAGFDQSQNLEHITKIRNEKVAFRPIDNPSRFKPWKSSSEYSSSKSEYSSKGYY